MEVRMATMQDRRQDRSVGDRAGAITSTVDMIAGAYGPATVRWFLGLMWLSNVNWKVPPDFGGLKNYVQAGIDHPVLPGSAWMFEHIVLPNMTPFGYLTLFVEVGLAALLLSGRFLRVAAVISVLQAFAIGLSVANAPAEWYWSYLLMIGLSIAVLVQAPRSRPTAPRTMGVVVALVGVVTAITTIKGGFGGDNSVTRSLFTGRNDIPDEFGFAIFVGSIALGLILIALGGGTWALAHARAEVRRGVGIAMIAVAALLLLTYSDSPDTLIIGLGSRAVHCGILATVGLCLLPWRDPAPEPVTGRSGTES